MLQITNITADPLQQVTFVLGNGISFFMEFYYVPQQYGWVITTLTYQNFTLNGVNITNNSNILYPFQNLIPFGLACYSQSQREPTQQLDFASGASSLWVLSQLECQALRTYIEGGALPP